MDRKLRSALEHLRYKSKSDLQFLESRRVKKHKSDPDLSSPTF